MSIIKGVKIGTTDITSTYNDGDSRSDTKSLEVTPVSLGFIYKPDDTVYTGNPITPTPIVKATVEGVVETLELGIDYTLSYVNNVNVGEATVIATGIGNYTGTVQNTWNITGAQITVTADDQSYTYDGSYHGHDITVVTVNNQTYTVKYRLTSSGTYNLTEYPTFKNVVNSGYNNVVYYQVTAPNHITYEGSYQLQIYPKVVTLQWGETTWIYDGDEHQTICVVSNLVSGDTCTVILIGNTITDIGTNTVTATELDNTNYTLTGATDLSRTLTVTAGLFVKLSGVWTPVKKVYKKVSGSWVQQDMSTAFSTSKMYKKMN